jgi:hypothetical protein
MKNLFYIFMLLAVGSFILPGCATIIGGTRYYAKVQVPNYPDAKIEYNNTYEGTGEASFRVKRKEADNFTVTIKKDNCASQTVRFTQRQFRGWAFAGTLLCTGLVYYIPIPVGVIVDASTGAWWKPDITEKGVTKQDYNHYIYSINYTGCKKKDK